MTQDSKSVLLILEQHRKALVEKHRLERLALFGSHAREDARPDSDVDILVVFQGAPDFDRFSDLKDDLEAILHRKVDLVTESALRPQLRGHILKEARYVA